jgi:hypothetical protein
MQRRMLLTCQELEQHIPFDWFIFTVLLLLFFFTFSIEKLEIHFRFPYLS